MPLRTWTLAAGAAVLTTAMLATGSLAASANPLPADAAPAPSGECTFGEHLVRAWLHVPAELRGDLKDLKDLEPGDRPDAAREIRDAALAGEYGPIAQHRAEQGQKLGIRAIARFPEELRNDLAELRAAAKGDRGDLAQEIADTALAGGYGDRVQAMAERVQQSDAWQECAAG